MKRAAKTPRSFTFHDDCWDVTVVVVYPVDFDSLVTFLQARYPKGDLTQAIESAKGGFEGWSFIVEGEAVIALSGFSESTEDLGTLVHESTHAALQILFSSGVEVTDDNQEPFAYLHESIFRRCLKRLRLTSTTKPVKLAS